MQFKWRPMQALHLKCIHAPNNCTICHAMLPFIFKTQQFALRCYMLPRTCFFLYFVCLFFCLFLLPLYSMSFAFHLIILLKWSLRNEKKYKIKKTWNKCLKKNANNNNNKNTKIKLQHFQVSSFMYMRKICCM